MLARTATHSCRTQKHAFHFCLPAVVRRSHAAARQMTMLLYGDAAAAGAAGAAGDLVIW